MIFRTRLSTLTKGLILLALVFIGLAGLTAFSKQDKATVQHVLDGDTIILTDGRHIRYIGINSPEVAHENSLPEPYGDKALAFNQVLVAGKTVRLEYDEDKKDRYGRHLAYVYLKDGAFVNREMVSQGLAYCLYHSSNAKYSRALLEVQQQAMDNQKGLWAILPGEKQSIVGNSRSMRFHLPSCRSVSQTSTKNRVFFKSMKDAFYQGYAPCKRCLQTWW